jgi:hypothetical protein
VKLKNDRNSPNPAVARSRDGRVLALAYRLPAERKDKAEFNEFTGNVELLDLATGKLLDTIPLDTAGRHSCPE